MPPPRHTLDKKARPPEKLARSRTGNTGAAQGRPLVILAKPTEGSREPMLSLAEELFLLSLLEKKENLRLPPSLSLPFSLAGAVLIDLALTGSIKLEDGRLIARADLEPVQDAQMKRVGEQMRQADKYKRLDHWVFLLGVKGKRITKEILLALVEKNVLQEDEQGYQWAAQPQEDGAPALTHPKYLLKREVRDAVFCQTALDERRLALINLLDACDMLDHLFTKDEMVYAQKRMKLLKRGDHLSAGFLDLLDRMVNAVDYAVAAAIMK